MWNLAGLRFTPWLKLMTLSLLELKTSQFTVEVLPNATGPWKSSPPVEAADTAWRRSPLTTIDEEDATVPPAAGVVAIKVPGSVSIVPGVLAFCDSSWGTKVADPVRWKVSTSRLAGPKNWLRPPPVTTRLVTLGGALPTVSWEVPRMSRMLPAPSEIWLVAL